MKKISVLGIAPYEKLNEMMLMVAKSYNNIKINTFTADLEEGVEIFNHEINNNYDVIISRGGTAHLLKETATIPVIEINISFYDILERIQLAFQYSKNIAIVGYSNITKIAHLICDILKYNINIVTIDETSNVDEVLNELKKEEFELILCDMISNKTAVNKSINTILITSSIESVMQAFKKAIYISTLLSNLRNKNDLLTTALNDNSDCSLILNYDFSIIFSNISEDLSTKIISQLKKEDNDILYIDKSLNTYKVKISKINNYIVCTISSLNPPTIRGKKGILFHNKKEIINKIENRSYFSLFFSSDLKKKITNISNKFSSLIIYGQQGLFKSSTAYYIYSNINDGGTLITVDFNYINDEMWDYLLNNKNGPFVMNGNTILIKNIERASANNIRKLISIIFDTQLLKRNIFLFIYNVNNKSSNKMLYKLSYKLNSLLLYIPSLNDRIEEINILITRLLNIENITFDKHIIGFEPGALDLLYNFEWTNNFDQLIQIIKQLVISSESHYINRREVLQLIHTEKMINNINSTNVRSTKNENFQKSLSLNDYIKMILYNTLEQNNGNQTKTAKQLKISRTTLWRYLNNK